MKTKVWLVTAVCLLLIAPAAFAEEVAGLPLHIEKLNPKTIRLWIGDSISSTATVAFATEKGIVVIDTLGIPSVDAKLRKIIARELGRGDFKVLINTHEHGDHTGGNSVYADCAIVAHELCGPGMKARLADRSRVMEWYNTRIPELEAEIAKLETGSPELARKKEDLILARLNRENLEPDAKLVPPTKTFSDRKTLNMGDTTFELYYIGGMHSASDIAIFVPEQGLLLTGDTMADVWLTDTPGCLASFMARSGVRHDFPLLLENWGILLAKKDQIKDLIPGHWNGDLTFEGFEARVGYVKTLWEGINHAAAESKNLQAVYSEYELETAFPELAASPGFNARNNYGTITEIWATVTGQESAATRLAALIDEGAGEEALRKLVAQRDSKDSKYYFVEAEINQLGYRFLGEDEVAEAITVFNLNVHLYPDAWNVYDSLGEALLKSGKTTAAVEMYEKSLALNPDNTNGRDVLARIREASDSN